MGSKIYLFIVAIFIVAILSACQTTPKSVSAHQSFTQPLYLDQAFEGFMHVDVETVDEIFALDDDMKLMVVQKLLPERNTKKKAVKLLRQIFKSENANFAYRSGANVIATDAYHNKEANCLSLTIMAYALAKEAGLQIKFQDVKIPEYWVRNQHLNMLTGHVNLRVIENKRSGIEFFLERKVIEIDFDPFVVKKSFPKRDISKNRIVAMFYNNKGANAMVQKDFVKAYAYFKAASQIDPEFSAVWGNLAILYKFNQFEDEAVKGYRYALSLDQNNLTAMSNLSIALHKRGQIDEAKVIDKTLISKRASNPYYYALLGDERFYEGNYQEALRHFHKAIKLDENIHEFYFGLAKVHFKLKEYQRAEYYMKKAIKKNKIDTVNQQYIAKLHVLNQLNL